MSFVNNPSYLAPTRVAFNRTYQKPSRFGYRKLA